MGLATHPLRLSHLGHRKAEGPRQSSRKISRMGRIVHLHYGPVVLTIINVGESQGLTTCSLLDTID